jgi:hydroxymethylglutaryl-CoA lyase
MNTSFIQLRDVTLRDGLQDERPITTVQKLELLRALVGAGLEDLELASFTRPDRVPAMADADELAPRAIRDVPGAVFWGLVLNRRGTERALKAGLRHLQFVVSVSDQHNLENAGRPTDASMRELAEIRSLATEAGAELELTLATAFGCPFVGPIAPVAVLKLAEVGLEFGVDRLSLADTIGTAVPREVSNLVDRVVSMARPVEIGIHLHDTRGLAIANALTAMEAGVNRVDGTVGGLGGCPFAPGASGNLVLEDLVHALDAMGVITGLDLEGLLKASDLACRLVGRQPGGHVSVAGPRFAKLAKPTVVPG